MTADESRSAEALRQRAEALLSRSPDDLKPADLKSVSELAHELAVHQIELELQNDELRDTQQALYEARDRYAALYDNAPVGYVVLDASGIVRQTNTTWRAMLNRQEEDLRGKPFADVMVPEDAKVFLARFRTFFRNPKGKQIIVRMERKGGKPFHARIEARFGLPTTGDILPDDERTDLMVTVSDVTDLDEAQQQSDERNRELQQANDALRESSLRLHESIRAGNVGLWDWDLVTNQVRYSREWKQQIGYEEHEIGNSFDEWESRVHPDDLVATRERINQGITDLSTLYHVEFRFRHKDGSYRWILAQASVYCNEEGRPARVLGSHIDITDRKRAEEVLRARERYLHTILQTTADGFWVLNSEGKMVEVNDAYCAMSGYTRDEILGLTVADLDAQEAPAETAARIQRVIQHGGEVFETLHRRKDGTAFPVEVSTTFMDVEGGQFVCFCRDLTQRKQLERILRQHSHLLENTPNAIYVSDQQGRIVYANAAASTQTGYTRDDITRKMVWDVDADFSTQEYAKVVERLSHGRPVSFRTRHRRADGSLYPVELSLSRLEHGGTVLLCGVVRDMTEQDAREASLQRTQFSVDSAPICIFWLSPEGRFIYVNNKAARSLGYTREELLRLGVEHVDLNSPRETRESRWEFYKQAGETEFDSIHRRKDGSTFPVRVHSYFLEYLGEEMEVAEVEDITERKQREERIALMGRMLDAAPASITIHDTSGNFLYANEATCALHGYDDVGEFLSRNLHEVDVPESEALLAKRLQRIAEKGEARFEVGHYRKDGSTFPLEVLAKSIDWEGHPAILSIASDISERKKAEAALRESEERFRLLAELAPMGIVISNRQENTLYVSPKFVELFGYGLAEMPSVNAWWPLAYPDPALRERVQQTWSAAIRDARSRGKEVPPMEFPVSCKDGTVRHVEFRLSSTGDLNFVVLTDITERKRAEDQRAESYALLTNLAQLVPGVIYQYRLYPDGGSAFPYASPGMKAIYEISPEEVQKDAARVFDRLHPEDRERVSAAILESARTLATFYCEFRVLLPKQGLRWRWSQAHPQRMEDGGVLWHGIILDITERKQAEEALIESEERVRRKLQAVLEPEGDIAELALDEIVDTETIQTLMEDLYRVTGIGIAVADRSGRILVATGWQDICTKFHRLHPETRRYCLESDVLLSSGVEPGQFKMYKCKNNMWDIATPILLGENHVGNLYLGQFLYEDEKPDYDLFRAQARRFGFDEDEYLDALNRVPRWSRETVQAVMRFYSQFAAFVATLSYGNLKLARTLEERERIESERKKLEEQLIQAQKMESIGRLAGGVAHDFNNMLNIILGYADMLLQDLPSDTPAQEGIIEIRKAAQRSADLTRQLLAFARKQTIAPKTIDLNATVESMLSMLRRLIGEDIDLLWRPAQLLQMVRIDPAQIDQMLANLLVNARDAIGSGGGKVTIETAPAEFDDDYCAIHVGYTPGEYVMLAVSDNGRGMDEATKALIFEPFYTTKALGEGTGLGLATVYGIVSQNRGFINVYSELGQGTTFRIYLPVYLPGHARAAVEQVQAPAVEPGHETILMVEDEPAILELGKKMLERMGYRVLAAATPGEAIQLAKEHAQEIHLLITDVVMPEMNGRDLASCVLSLYPGMKRLFMSGYTADVIAHQGVLDEGVDFIQKPFSMQALSRKLRQVLDS